MSELIRLASEGEARRAAVAAEQAAEARRARIQERREVRRLGLSNLLNALDERPRALDVPLLWWTMGAVGVCTVLWTFAESVGAPALVTNIGLVGVLVIPFLYFGVRRWRAVLELRHERRWLMRLPFPVRGYFAVLSETPEEECSVRARIYLADEGPGEEVMRGLAGRTGTAAEVRRTGAGWEVESGPILCPVFGDTEPTNGPRLSWMRALLEEMALPLHGEHRVTGVRFRG